jgi:hypothetical protein
MHISQIVQDSEISSSKLTYHIICSPTKLPVGHLPRKRERVLMRSSYSHGAPPTSLSTPWNLLISMPFRVRAGRMEKGKSFGQVPPNFFFFSETGSHSLGWPRIHKPPASAFLVLGLQVCTTELSCDWFLLSCIPS